MNFGRLCTIRPRPFAAISCTLLLILVSACSKTDSGLITAETSKFQVGDEGTAPSNSSGSGSLATSSRPFGALTDETTASNSRQSSAQNSANTSLSDGSLNGSSGRNGASNARRSSDPGSAGVDDGNSGVGGGGTSAGVDPGATKRGDPITDPAAIQLLRQISELGSRQPQGRNREEAIAEFRDTHTQRIAVAEKLLDMDTEVPARIMAAQSVLESLNILEQIGTPNVRPQQHAFSKKIAKDKAGPIARLGQLMLFSILVDDFGSDGDTTQKDVVEQLEKLLGSDDQDQRSLMIAAQAVGILKRKGADTESQSALDLIIKTFRDHKVPELALQAQQLELQLHMMAVLEDKEGAGDVFISALEKLLTGPNAVGSLELANNIERQLEVGQQGELALRVLDQMQKVVDSSSDPQIAELSKLIALARRRNTLIGKEFRVDLPTMDGKPLDWSQYKGKIVLVDFWATWCGPCLQEIPNIRKTLEEYQDRGFAVLGVSLDEERQELDRFFSLQKLPWTTVINAASTTKDGETFAIKSGVDSIPFTVLVGRDGNVVAVSLRGQMLADKVQELLDAESKTEPTEKAPKN